MTRKTLIGFLRRPHRFSILRVFAFIASTAMAPLVLTSGLADAQQLSGAALDQAQQLQQVLQNQGLQGGAGQNGQSQPGQNQSIILQPDYSQSVSLPTSRIEQILSARAGTKLRQFGYDDLGSGRPVTVPQTGAIQDDYILGTGDEIVVSLRGQENAEYRAVVDRDGRALLPRLGPISASGRSLGAFRQDLEAAVHNVYISTQAFVSIGRLRQVNVIVAGEVYSPGVRLLTGLSSPVDAILLSGGVKKTGSLRNVKLVRAGQQFTVDLYGFLTQQGRLGVTKLMDGDRIVVPSLGATVAVTGWVRHPAIYELAPGQSGMSVHNLLALAGGLEVRGRYRLSVLRVLPNGSSGMTAQTSEGALVRDSEVLFVQPNAQETETQATLAGGTALAGQYSLNKATQLSEILKAPGALGQSPYTLFGIISRRDPATLLRTLVAFTPAAVLSNRENADLLPGDVVRVFNLNEGRLLAAVVKAFEERRAAAQAMILAPQDIRLGTGLENPCQKNRPTPYDVSPAEAVSISPSLNVPGQPTGLSTQSTQSTTPTGMGFQSGPDDERRDIAALSCLRIGDGGLLVLPVLPSPQPSTINEPVQIGQNGQGAFTQQMPVQQGAPYYPTPYAGSLNSGPLVQQGAVPSRNGMQDSPTDSERLPPNMQESPFVPGHVATNQEISSFGALALQLDVDPLALMHFLMDHEATLGGAVGAPGNYIVGPNVSLADLVGAAGGTSGWADESGVEVVSTTIVPATGYAQTDHQLLPLRAGNLVSYNVRSHDQIQFHKIDTLADAGSVTIQGQVRFAGTYQIERGERLSELLLRAGGLTDVAYPYGTVFLRKSVAVIERDGYQRAAKDMQEAMIASMTRVGNEKVQPEAFASMQTFVAELRNQKALGRIAIMADPGVLASDPSRDPLLESGDFVFIPQRPSTVAVLGNVMQPSSIPARPGMTVTDYIKRAGGYGQFANGSLTFVVLPDGTARSVETSWLSIGEPEIPPGSAIVVPREISPIDLRQVVLDLAGVLSQLAVSAASLSVIQHN